jgi:hypothetical protein
MHVNSFCKTACTCASIAHPDGNSIGGPEKLTLKTMLDLLCCRIDPRQHACTCRFIGARPNAAGNAKGPAP